MSWLEEGNTKENREHYGVIISEEVKNCTADFNRDISAGPDNLTLADLKILTNSEFAIALTKWWEDSIPSSAKQYRTTFIPKIVNELKDSPNLQPITISNMLMRLYVKI